MMLTSPPLNLAELKTQFERDGFCVVRGLFSPEEVEEIKVAFEGMNRDERALRVMDTRYEQNIADREDPLALYPRIVHPHKFNETARRYMLHAGVWEVLAVLFGEDPLAVQSMFYFKPPGARGQAMHQDQFYLMVQPGTCVAAWTAIDDCDAENGGMYVVPETGDAEVMCPAQADAKESFTTHFVPTPKGKKARLVEMRAGDTLFFNGSALHGSGPNRSKERFRRSFIGHYAAGSLEKIAKFYQPLIARDGSEVAVEVNADGGPCGAEWSGGMH